MVDHLIKIVELSDFGWIAGIRIVATDFEPAVLISPVADQNCFKTMEFDLEVGMIAVFEEEAHRFSRYVAIKRYIRQMFEFGQEMKIEVSSSELRSKR